MKTHVRIAATLLLAVAGLFLIGQAASNLARPTSTAVVNIEQVVDALTEKQQMDVQLKQRRDAIAAEQQSRQKQIEKLEFDLNALKPGSDAFLQKQDELLRYTLEMQVWTRFEQARAGREMSLQTERLYNKIIDAVGRVAQDNGYQLVLFRESDPDMRVENPQQLSVLIQMRKVLYASDSIDLTDQVIQRMNNEYEAMR